MSGRIVIFSGPSGVGKDTLLEAWRERDPRVSRVVAYTTRSPRAGEQDGVDYHFVTIPEFLAKADNGEFLEFKEVHGNYYATPLADMQRMIDKGLIAVLKIDVQGAIEAMEKRPDALSIFIEPPSWEELERRIRSRALDDDTVIAKRLLNARAEMDERHRYVHHVVNDSLGRAVDELQRILAEAG